MRLHNLLTAVTPCGLITCDQSVSPSSRPAMIEHSRGPGSSRDGKRLNRRELGKRREDRRSGEVSGSGAEGRLLTLLCMSV